MWQYFLQQVIATKVRIKFKSILNCYFNLFQDDFLALKNESDLDDLCDLSTDDSLTENEKMIVGSQETWDPDV
jgi:hypothetical protein